MLFLFLLDGQIGVFQDGERIIRMKIQSINELEALGATNNLRGLAANIKFIAEIVTQDDEDVKQNYSERDPTAEALRAAWEKENGKL